MTAPKEKAASPCQGEAALQTNHKQDHTAIDPLMGWHALAKPSRDRQQKKAWLRRKGGAR